MLLAEPVTHRVIGLAIELHRHSSVEAFRFCSVVTVFSAPPCIWEPGFAAML